jgi:hypothetical protein
LSVRSRFDEQTWNAQRFEAEARANFDHRSVSIVIMYGNYAPQPEFDYLPCCEGLLASGAVKVAANWVAADAERRDFVANVAWRTNRVKDGHRNHGVIVVLRRSQLLIAHYFHGGRAPTFAREPKASPCRSYPGKHPELFRSRRWCK